LQLAEMVISLTGSTAGIERRPLPENDPVRRKPDIMRARELLGWAPTVELAAGLERTIEYFRGLHA